MGVCTSCSASFEGDDEECKDCNGGSEEVSSSESDENAEELEEV